MTTATLSKPTKTLERLAQTYIPPVARTALVSVFLISGLTKLGQYAGTQGYMESVGVPGELLPLVIALEILAPLAIIIGWQTRIAAVLLAGFAGLSALMFHFDFSDQIQTIMFLKNISIAGGLGLLAAFGAGTFALDNRKG
ncbi:DoxX family protein [Litorimonas sp. WD9-15]|uniref:DoxX family protein n=1 Tax=Litorimonas sp. WD9-15 TaxID=3418716 RepID=UPI003D06004F